MINQSQQDRDEALAREEATTAIKRLLASGDLENEGQAKANAAEIIGDAILAAITKAVAAEREKNEKDFVLESLKTVEQLREQLATTERTLEAAYEIHREEVEHLNKDSTRELKLKLAQINAQAKDWHELTIYLEGNPYSDPDFMNDSRALKAAVKLRDEVTAQAGTIKELVEALMFVKDNAHHEEILKAVATDTLSKLGYPHGRTE